MSTRGFAGNLRPTGEVAARLPPGQHLTTEFPVLTAGPTQHTALNVWGLALEHGARTVLSLDWQSFAALPQTHMKADIHCVTTWSKLGTDWRGVTFDDLLRAGGLIPELKSFVMAHCDGGYTTNLPMADLTDGKGMVATHFGGAPLSPEHGGPARLLVPHLYFWKSAKWLRRIEFLAEDRPGFWESNGYHMYGDPHREQRYRGD